MVKGGVDIAEDGLKLCSESINEIVKHEVAVIMGANVADEVARGDFCEATIGASNKEVADVFHKLFNMKTFITHFYPKTKTEVFSESCGVADLITTCFGGRNRKCAAAYAESRVRGEPRSWDEI